jgi:hypothetical protein
MRPFLLLLCAVLPMMALAQDDPTAREVYPERSEVTFSGPLEVEGQLIRPSGDVVNSRVNGVFKPFIELRRNFSVEMAESVNEVR